MEGCSPNDGYRSPMTATTIAAPARPEDTLKVPAAAPGYEEALGSADGCGGGMVTVLFPEVSLLPLPVDPGGGLPVLVT